MIDAETIANALGGKRYGNCYRSPCPVCGGSDKSTKFSTRDAGHTILVRCFAGCTQQAVISELRNRGLWLDATPEQRQQWSEMKRARDRDFARTYVLVAESAQERGETLSAQERRKLFVSRKLIEVDNG